MPLNITGGRSNRHRDHAQGRLGLGLAAAEIAETKTDLSEDRKRGGPAITAGFKAVTQTTYHEPERPPRRAFTARRCSLFAHRPPGGVPSYRIDSTAISNSAVRWSTADDWAPEGRSSGGTSGSCSSVSRRRRLLIVRFGNGYVDIISLFTLKLESTTNHGHQ